MVELTNFGLTCISEEVVDKALLLGLASIIRVASIASVKVEILC